VDFFTYTLQTTRVSAAVRNTGRKKKVFRCLLKFRVILIIATFLNPNIITKVPYHPPMFRERG